MSLTQVLKIRAHDDTVGVMRYWKSSTEVHDVQLYPSSEVPESYYQVLLSTGLSDVSA